MTLPIELEQLVAEVLAAEQAISYGNPVPYNAYVAETPDCTAISASGRIGIGVNVVRTSSVKVAQGSIGEHDRRTEFISGSYTDEMFYAVVKTAVTVEKDDGTENPLCWLITLVFRKLEGRWQLVHRQNTRSSF